MMHPVTTLAYAVDVKLPNDIWRKIGNIVNPGTQEHVVGIVKLASDFCVAQRLTAYVFSMSSDNPRHERVISGQ